MLLVDDDADDRAIVVNAFEELNAADIISCVENGVDALDFLASLSPTNGLPCLIILDLNMPKMNGTETLKRLKAEPLYQNIPVIIYSTSINPLEQEKCMLLGAHSYLAKPVSYRESIDTARYFIDFCKAEVPSLQKK